MPSLETKIIETVLQGKNEEYPVFVETGTYNGETTFKMEKIFKLVHTIEVAERYYSSTKNKYFGNKIVFHLGDSSEVLHKIIPTINENTIYFLDGHYSGGKTGFGKKHVPLYEELETIMRLHKQKAIIIIDDYRIFNTLDGGICDWTSINKDTCINIVNSRLNKVYHLPSELHPEDRLIFELSCE